MNKQSTRHSWRSFQSLSSRYRDLQIRMLMRTADDLPDMSVKQLCVWGALLIKALRHAHNVIRNNSDLVDEQKHWAQVRGMAQQQLTAMLSIVESHLEDETLPVWDVTRAFEFVGAASAVFQEEAFLDRELNADPEQVIGDEQLARLSEEFGELLQ